MHGKPCCQQTILFLILDWHNAWEESGVMLVHNLSCSFPRNVYSKNYQIFVHDRNQMEWIPRGMCFSSGGSSTVGRLTRAGVTFVSRIVADFHCAVGIK